MTVRVTALGSGDAFGGAGRHASCWLLRDAAGAALVDVGPGVLQGLYRAGVDPGAIAAVHFTHLHGDHLAGWPFLLLDQARRARRTDPLAVTGPPGTQGRLHALWAACYADTAQRPLPFVISITELSPGESLEVAGRTVHALRAQHQRPPHVALSLRLHTSGGVLAFTGDTGPHEGLVALAAGARALFAECSELEARTEVTVGAALEQAQPGHAAIGRRHLAWSDLRALLPLLEVRDVALTHLGAAPRAARARLEAEGAALGKNLTVCDDGTTLHLD